MNRKIKICHIVTRLQWGGGAKRIIHLLNGLDKDMFKVDLIVSRDVYPSQIERLRGVNLIELDSMVRSVNPVLDVKTLILLYGILRKSRHDIVHTHVAKAGVLGRIAGKLSGVPIIIHTLHGTTFHQGYNPLVRRFNILLEKFLSSFTDCYISTGRDLKNSYIKQNIGDPSRHVVIHSGMDLTKFFNAGKLSAKQISKAKEELGLGRDNVVVGKVSRFATGKGHRFAIETAKIITQQYPWVTFVFVGEGLYRNTCEKMVADYGLKDSVIFLGFREDIADVMALFDIVFFTSLWEGLPQVLVQATAMGKPIVTFDVYGVREIVKDGLNGFIVPLKDVDQLVEKIDYLLSDLARAREMGLKGRGLIDDSWSVETMVQQTDALYQRLLRERGIR